MFINKETTSLEVKSFGECEVILCTVALHLQGVLVSLSKDQIFLDALASLEPTHVGGWVGHSFKLEPIGALKQV